MPAESTTHAHAAPQGRFVVVEGADGAGKTDLCALLARALRDEGREVVELREPGGTPLGEQIRSILKDPAQRIGDRAEALLFAAARAQIIEEQIRPALSRGAWVICDRHVDSSVIYQGLARGLGQQQVRSLSEFAVDGLVPDGILVLQVDPRVAAQRMRARDGDVGDRIEQGIDMGAVRRGYETITERNATAVDVDANGGREQTLAAALSALANLRDGAQRQA